LIASFFVRAKSQRSKGRKENARMRGSSVASAKNRRRPVYFASFAPLRLGAHLQLPLGSCDTDAGQLQRFQQKLWVDAPKSVVVY
jgi:hypothetical protein